MTEWDQIKAERKDDRIHFENSKAINKALEGKLFSSQEQIIEGIKRSTYGTKKS